MTKGGKVFLSGASGFIATHILDQLIKEGYAVTASVRSNPKAEQVLELHPEWKGKVNFVFVGDVGAEGAFDDVFKNEAFEYVIHTASPVKFDVTDIKRDLIDPAVVGTVTCLESAHEYGGNQIKRFVLLGSAVAVLDSYEDMSTTEGKTAYTEEDWNSITTEKAVKSGSSVDGYVAGKTEAERAAWKFMKEKKPVFDMTVINPDIVIGPMLQPVAGPQQINDTNAFLYGFISGFFKELQEFPFFHSVDVRDVAKASVLSLNNPKASNQRILLVSGLYTPQLIVNIIREKMPAIRDRVVEGKPTQLFARGKEHPNGWNTDKSFEIFGKDWSYIPLEKSIVDFANSVSEYEKRWKKE